MERTFIQGVEVLYSEFKMKENAELKTFLQSKKFQTFLQRVKKGILVVVGGDGTMLEAIASERKRDVPFLGVNFGHKGFLLNDVSILQGKSVFEKRQYPLLECKISGKKKVAFNEFDIKAGDGKMLDIDMHVGEGHALNVVGDGLIISTPTGSTGYNSSLGGPILPHSLNAYVITPKAPWKPRGLAPIILKENQKLHLTIKGRLTPIEMYSDGREFLKIHEKNVEIDVYQSKKRVTLLVSKHHISYWDNKVLEEQGFTLKP